MFAVFLFYFFFGGNTHETGENTHETGETPEMIFSCKTVNFFNTVINNISKKYIVWAGILTKHHQNH